MTRIFQASELLEGEELILGESQSHHISTVLRMRVGDALTVFNGCGGEYLGRICAIKKKCVCVQLETFLDIERESDLKLYLAQGICRNERMDFLVQKAVELGVTGIVPVLTEKQTFKFKPDVMHKKIAHWQAIAISACEQSGRNRVPKIFSALPLNQLSALHKADHYLCLSPAATTKLANLKLLPTATVLFVIGPEAGFSENEIKSLTSTGFISLSMGTRILRTETAGLALLAILQSHFGDI